MDSKYGELCCLVEKAINKLVTNENSSGINELFTHNIKIRNKFYKYFFLSGASLVIADNLNRKVVLLQDQVVGAQGIPTVNMPVYKNGKHKGLFVEISSLSNESYNYLANRLFQLQRSQQGMRVFDEDKNVVFKDVPDFLTYLKSIENGPSDDRASYKLFTAHEYLYAFIVWRFLIWSRCCLSGSGENQDIDLSSLNFESLTRETANRYSGDENYFHQDNIRNYARKKIDLGEGGAKDKSVSLQSTVCESVFFDDFYPERSVYDLNLEESAWEKDGMQTEFKIWESFQRKVDSIKDDFSEELSMLNQIFDSTYVKKLNYFIDGNTDHNIVDHNLLKLVINHFFNSTIGIESSSFALRNVHDYLTKLHEKFPVLIPYYYFSLFDEQPKSHLIFSIWHSRYHPIEFLNIRKSKLETHTSVLNCVAALNSSLEEDLILKFIYLLKVVTESIVNGYLVSNIIRTEQQRDTYQFERILNLSRFYSKNDEFNKVFYLGIKEERITFTAQQSRAMNLVRSLVETGLLKKNDRLAILGGGLSGVTAATAALYTGVMNISLFESKGDILTIQSSAEHRQIHPFIYDWPSTIYEQKQTYFPFLNWSHGAANEVVNSVKTEFNELVGENTETVFVHKSSQVTNVDGKGSSLEVTVSDLSKKEKQTIVHNFDVIISALGFGEESKLSKLKSHTKGYWEKDDLDDLEHSEESRILICGAGDGALVDLMRSKLSAVQKDIFRLTTNTSFFELGRKMLQLDRIFVVNNTENSKKVHLFDFYKSNIEKGLLEEPIKSLRKMYRPNIHIVHSFRNHKLAINTSLINRLVVFLLHCDRQSSVKWSSGETKFVEPRGNQFRARFKGYEEDRFDVFDKVISHVGVKPEEQIEKVFPAIKLNKKDIRKNLNFTNHISHDTFKWYEELKSKHDASKKKDKMQ